MKKVRNSEILFYYFIEKMTINILEIE